MMIFVLIASFLNMCAAIAMFGRTFSFSVPWLGWGLDFSLRLYHFSSFIILAVSIFGFLIMMYSAAFMRDRKFSNAFYILLLSVLLFVEGAVLADNLIVMLFFWEGLLGLQFAMIAIGGKNAFRTAAKSFIILGICDLCMMIGIVLTGYLAGTLQISNIHLPITHLSSLAFILLMIGAISKAGSMPFHTWIPDAAIDAPLPFMAFLPAALEKLLGIYFLARIALDMFALTAASWLSPLLMIIGCLTILFAVMMALIQKDYKRLLSYHAISQVGYMILGIGTAVPAGIVGGLFHMINHAMYKSGLFLTGGSVEKQTGTTDLEKLGGIGWKMPVTFACFIITACSISGVPPFNGFFSKELVYDGALERGWIYYAAAVGGSFLTAASFLKLGHAAYMDKARGVTENVKETSIWMQIPMICIALGCVIFGLFNWLPIRGLIQPILGSARLEGHDFAGMPKNPMLIIITLVVIAAAILNHFYGVKIKGSGLKAVDHIHYAPGLGKLYDMAEKRMFDPYEIGLKFTSFISSIGWKIDRAVDWLYEVFAVRTAEKCTHYIRKAHNGNYSFYMMWSLFAMLIVLWYLVR